MGTLVLLRHVGKALPLNFLTNCLVVCAVLVLIWELGLESSCVCVQRHGACACRNVMVGMGPWPAEMLWVWDSHISCAFLSLGEHGAKACFQVMRWVNV